MEASILFSAILCSMMVVAVAWRIEKHMATWEQYAQSKTRNMAKKDERKDAIFEDIVPVMVGLASSADFRQRLSSLFGNKTSRINDDINVSHSNEDRLCQVMGCARKWTDHVFPCVGENQVCCRVCEEHYDEYIDDEVKDESLSCWIIDCKNPYFKDHEFPNWRLRHCCESHWNAAQESTVEAKQ